MPAINHPLARSSDAYREEPPGTAGRASNSGRILRWEKGVANSFLPGFDVQTACLDSMAHLSWVKKGFHGCVPIVVVLFFALFFWYRSA